MDARPYKAQPFDKHAVKYGVRAGRVRRLAGLGQFGAAPRPKRYCAQPCHKIGNLGAATLVNGEVATRFYDGPQIAMPAVGSVEKHFDLAHPVALLRRPRQKAHEQPAPFPMLRCDQQVVERVIMAPGLR